MKFHLPLFQTELKVEIPLYKKSEAALRCFRRAVELEDASRKLWLEFGSLAYQLHSHASRQIRYRNMFNISGEMLLVGSKHEIVQDEIGSKRTQMKCQGYKNFMFSGSLKWQSIIKLLGLMQRRCFYIIFFFISLTANKYAEKNANRVNNCEK